MSPYAVMNKRKAGATKRQHIRQYSPGLKPIMSRISSQNLSVPKINGKNVLFYLYVTVYPANSQGR